MDGCHEEYTRDWIGGTSIFCGGPKVTVIVEDRFESTVSTKEARCPEIDG